MKKRLTKEEFIERAKEIHGNKYDYSKVEYKNYGTKVCIICPIHGEFWQTPCNHLYGKGCNKCAKLARGLQKRKGVDGFIEEARKIHGDKYDYSKVNYVNNHTKVCIICHEKDSFGEEHGEFWQTPQHHLKKHGCPKCAKRFRRRAEDFIKESKRVHGDKYDYSKVEYINTDTKVCIVCPQHGEFWQLPLAHLRGQGCPKCADIKNGLKRILGKDEFLKRATYIHGDKYDYSKVEYLNNHTKVCIICPIHGEFWQTPCKHLYGNGCPNCNNSMLEEQIKIFFDANKIEYEYQYRIEWLKNENNNFLSLDFFLPRFNLAIECQGIQHFKPVKRFGGEEMFFRRIKNDEIKKKLCEEHNIDILYIVRNEINTNMRLYTNNNTILLNEITLDKIKNASH